MHRLRTRTSKDEERDRQDDRADHHEWQAGFGRRGRASALGDPAAVVALLDRAGKDDDEDDTDEDTHEGEADFAGVETVGEEDDLEWIRFEVSSASLETAPTMLLCECQGWETYRVGKEECCSFGPEHPSACVQRKNG